MTYIATFTTQYLLDDGSDNGRHCESKQWMEEQWS